MAQVGADTSPLVQPTQSTRFWIDDGSVVFRAGDVLYKVHLSHLKQLSPVVRGIFEIPDSMTGAKQGSEENPIILEFFSAVVFDDFLSWIYRAEWQPIENIQDVEIRERMLVNLLQVARLWDIAEAVAHTKHHLDLMYLRPSRRLELARMYTLYDWIDDAVWKLVTGKLEWLTNEDLARLGVKVYSIIASAKEGLWYETRLSCRVPPEVSLANPAWVSDEHNHRVCAEVFNEIWWTRIAKKMMDPVKPLHFCEVAAEVKSTVFQVQRAGTWKKMEDACKDDMVAMIERENFFSEKALIYAASRAVEKYFSSL
ncbi:hypothetical protein B0H17DRAFT_1338951 [Mycena rosella]|uniref:BTB domain-containing protein n=1 Tax=Mycena rosella TaxID=1033263 RepID=A0AAD7CD94_MYCRO|nr:hypothetical protein B0H17DRAFT_1338951 [Mycena rosella]